MVKVISEEQMEQLGEYVRDKVLPHRLSEVRSMATDMLEIIGIEITVR